MRFLALFVVTAATCCLATILDPDDIDNEFDDFMLTAMQRMPDSGLWGAKRQNRTSDIIILNRSRQPFRLAKSQCVQGKLSTGLLPENKLNENSSTVFRIESSNYRQGVQCSIMYQSTQKNYSWFTVMIHNPFYGDNAAYASSSWDLIINPVVGHRNNNQVGFAVRDKNVSGHLSASSAQDGALPLRKPKGNRNKFVKTSKSGSRSHQL